MFVFLTYLIVFLLKFRSGELVGCEIWFRIQRVPTLHTFDGPRYTKNKKYLKKHDDDIYPQNKKYLKKTWWWCHHHVFSGIYCFWGSEVHQKYAVWVLFGCGIKFRVQRALLIEIWVKTQGDMLKIRTKKSIFFFSSSKVNKYYFIILTIILLFPLGGLFWVEIFSNSTILWDLTIVTICSICLWWN